MTMPPISVVRAEPRAFWLVGWFIFISLAVFLFSDEEIEFYVVLISINNNLRIILNPFRLSNL